MHTEKCPICDGEGMVGKWPYQWECYNCNGKGVINAIPCATHLTKVEVRKAWDNLPEQSKLAIKDGKRKIGE